MIDRRFVLFKKVARGGMAEIFLGKLIGEDGFERVCCFKRILPHFAVEKEFIEMFRDEAHIGKRLQHPNIVRVEGFEEVDGAYAIIMEFINGADLRGVMSACTTQKLRIPIPFAVHIIAEAARGLHYAHVKKDDITNKPLGIVHRDISPQNILVSFEGEVKVTDFGIADADSKLTETKTGVVKGKFSYMSPEQISAEHVDARTDVFALSIILWEMLTGRRLFHSDNEIIIIQLVRDCIIPEDIRSYNPDIDEDLEKIIAKGLRKNVMDRFESAAQFEKELRLYQSKHYPGYSSDNVSEFLGTLMRDKRESLATDIKELLSNKDSASSKPAVEIDLRQVTSTNNSPLARSELSKLHSKTNITQTGTKTVPLAPTQTRMNSPSEMTQRGQVPRAGQTQRRYVQQKKDTSTRNLIIAGIVVAILAAAGLAFFIAKKKLLSSTVTWSITTIPDTTKLEFDGQMLNNGKYLKSPVILHDLTQGTHKLVASRPGFESNTTTVTLSADKNNSESTIVLKQVEQMAPLRLILKESDSPVHFSLDDGLVDGQLKVETARNINYITFGEEHLLIVDVSDNSSFSCQFTPRAQKWDAPFLVVVNPSTKKCSYPLR